MNIKKEDCFYLGAVLRAHGMDGTVMAALDVDQPDYYKALNEAYLFLNDSLIRFVITSFNIQRDNALVKFENINNPDDAALITGCEIYLPLTKLPPLTGNQFYFHEIIGFTIIDNNFGEVGAVNQIYDMPQQAIAQVFHGEKEVLVPLNLVLVNKIDRVNKKLFMSLPDGLVALYIA